VGIFFNDVFLASLFFLAANEDILISIQRGRYWTSRFSVNSKEMKINSFQESRPFWMALISFKLMDFFSINPHIKIPQALNSQLYLSQITSKKLT